MLVVDASVLQPALSFDNDAGEAARVALESQQLAAPGLIDVEVLSILRRHVTAGLTTEARARTALVDLATSGPERHPHERLLARAWELRHSVTAYDAVYVALAEQLAVPLLTADARLARAPGPRCEIRLLSE